MSTNWLPLVDYSNKYRISISTLRRRIKLESIPFKLDSGKYFIIDESPDQALEASQESSHTVNTKQAPPKDLSAQKKNFSGHSAAFREDPLTTKGVSPNRGSQHQEPSLGRNPDHHEPVFSAANR